MRTFWRAVSGVNGGSGGLVSIDGNFGFMATGVRLSPAAITTSHRGDTDSLRVYSRVTAQDTLL